MVRQTLPPLAVALSVVDCINRADLDGLGALMTGDHSLVVLDEAPLVGRGANIEAWRGYFTAFPEYVIHPRHLVASGGTVAVLGTTTGSHVGLPDEEEIKLGVIWLAVVAGGQLSRWQVAGDAPEIRRQVGIPPTA